MSRRWSIFVISASLFILSQFYRTSNAVIASHLIRDLGLDTRGIGLMSASFFYAFALTQIPLSVLLDKIGSRKMMTGLSLLGIAGAILFSQADSLMMGIAGRILLGIGMACNLMGTLKLLTDWFRPLVFATLSGIIVSLGTVGNMVSTTPLVYLVEKMGWRASFLVIAAVNLLLVIVFYIVARDRPAVAVEGGDPEAPTMSMRRAIGNMGRLLKKKDYWIISSATFVRYGTFAAFQALWAGPFLTGVLGFSVVKTGNLIFLMNLGLILGGPLWGTVSDRIIGSRKWPIFAGLVSIAVINLILAYLSRESGFVFVAILMFVYGLLTSTSLLMYPHIKDLVPADMAGAAMTGVNFFTMMGPAVFLQGLGILMQTLYPQASRGPAAFTTGLLLCMGCQAVVAILYLFTRDKPIPKK